MQLKQLLASFLATGMLLGGATAMAAGGFPDVPNDVYYADAVEWAVEQGITNGTGDGLFAPDTTVTRSQAVAFLWRMSGQPTPTQTQTFFDVENDPNKVWYETAVQWAVEQGITNGTGDGMFSPDVTCDRAMIITMLYRMEGSPLDNLPWDMDISEGSTDISSPEDFGNAMALFFVETIRQVATDVKAGDYFELPMVWAALSGVLTQDHVIVADAEQSMTFFPTNPCPRGEMVFFLQKTSEYNKLANADSSYRTHDDIETGTVNEQVIMDKDGLKITLKGIENGFQDEVWLSMTAENYTNQDLNVEANRAYTNTYYTILNSFIPVKEEQEYGTITYYEDVIVPAGQSRTFYVSLENLNYQKTKAIYEVELEMIAYVREYEEGYYSYTEFTRSEPTMIHTSLYDGTQSYELEGQTIYDQNGVKLVAITAVNDAYSGPQIRVCGYNAKGEEIAVELADLKLDGKSIEAHADLILEPGKRSVTHVYIELDYDNIPTVQNAELTFRFMDPETWEYGETLAPATIHIDA